MDLLGPMDEHSISGARYAAVSVDECTRFVTVKPMELRSDFISIFQASMNEVRPIGFHVRGLRTDHAGEFTSKSLKDFCVKPIQCYILLLDLMPHSKWGLLRR